jgi:hypothetical protein
MRNRSRGDRVDLAARYELKQNERCALCVDQSIEERRKDGSLHAVNSRYAFKLSRSASDAPWLLTGTATDLSRGYPFDIGARFHVASILDNQLNLDYGLLGNLPELVKDPDFVVKRVSPVRRGGVELAEVEFTCKPKQAPARVIDNQQLPGGWLRLRGGTLLLDPNQYWLLREYQVEKEYPGQPAIKYHGTLQYATGPSGKPIMKRVLITFTKTGDEEEETRDFDLHEDASVPDKDFTLSAFGFPEPPGLDRPIPFFVWILGGTIAAFVLAIGITCLKPRLFRRAARRG